MIVVMFASLLYVVHGVVATILVVVSWRLGHGLHRFRYTTTMTPAQVLKDMPSVSVVIPARNESHAMTDCLQAVINSTYPKLEIIVLNDSSADRTSSLIKAFAHDGVRFIDGVRLPEGWLGKNHALDSLVREASGTYVLFMDVDTRIAPSTIAQLVAYTVQEKAAMVSVLPRREDGIQFNKLFSPLRYFWEIIFHRTESPAVASSGWLVERASFMDAFGGFPNLKDRVQPEAAVAAHYDVQGRYRFVIGTSQLGLHYEKKWRSQVATSIRLLFPLIGGRFSQAFISVLDLLIVVSPLFIIAAGAFIGWTVHQAIALILWTGFAVMYAVYLQRVWKRGWWLAAWFWSITIIQEAILILVSACKYIRGRVLWKGRPVMLSAQTQPAGRTRAKKS